MAVITISLLGVSGCIGWAIGVGKGEGVAGFFLGLLLGPIGWLVAALLTATPKVEAERLMLVAEATAALSGTAVHPPYPPVVATDRLAQLERLQLLRQQGALTEEEFLREKTRVL
jgi:hypothetical protein